MTKNKLRKWAEKLTRGSLRIDKHCAKWVVTLRKPAGPGKTETVQVRGRTLNSAAQQLLPQLVSSTSPAC